MVVPRQQLCWAAIGFGEVLCESGTGIGFVDAGFESNFQPCIFFISAGIGYDYLFGACVALDRCDKARNFSEHGVL